MRQRPHRDFGVIDPAAISGGTLSLLPSQRNYENSINKESSLTSELASLLGLEHPVQR